MLLLKLFDRWTMIAHFREKPLIQGFQAILQEEIASVNWWTTFLPGYCGNENEFNVWSSRGRLPRYWCQDKRTRWQRNLQGWVFDIQSSWRDVIRQRDIIAFRLMLKCSRMLIGLQIAFNSRRARVEREIHLRGSYRWRISILLLKSNVDDDAEGCHVHHGSRRCPERWEWSVDRQEMLRDVLRYTIISPPLNLSKSPETKICMVVKEEWSLLHLTALMAVMLIYPIMLFRQYTSFHYPIVFSRNRSRCWRRRSSQQAGRDGQWALHCLDSSQTRTGMIPFIFFRICPLERLSVLPSMSVSMSCRARASSINFPILRTTWPSEKGFTVQSTNPRTPESFFGRSSRWSRRRVLLFVHDGI